MEPETSTGPADGTAGPAASSSGSGSGGTTVASTGAPTGATDSTTGDIGAICPSVLDPVCGKDGETYDNACVARAAGVEIRREGPCLGDCEGSCVVAPQGPSLLALCLVVLLAVRPRRPRAPC